MRDADRNVIAVIDEWVDPQDTRRTCRRVVLEHGEEDLVTVARQERGYDDDTWTTVDDYQRHNIPINFIRSRGARL